jgi:hypothetical protein
MTPGERPCAMIPYELSTKRSSDFTVRYRLLSQPEYEVEQQLFQHIRCDWLYAGDDPQKDGISMIWPQFVSEHGTFIEAGPVPREGYATMWIVNADLARELHRNRVVVGARGFFVVGHRRIAEAEIVAIGEHLSPC